jgi:hypothetical protein
MFFPKSELLRPGQDSNSAFTRRAHLQQMLKEKYPIGAAFYRVSVFVLLVAAVPPFIGYPCPYGVEGVQIRL